MLRLDKVIKPWKESAFHTQVRKRLVQALEDSICAMLLLCFVWHKPFVRG